MNIHYITPLVLTFNEEPNIRRCLERLEWARRIVVLDSGSTDQTLEICKEFPNVKAIHRAFDNHTSQWNHGIDATTTEWVLALDADYIAPYSLVDELRSLSSDENAAFQASFRYVSMGRRLRGTLYPERALLFAKSRCRYTQDGHTQLLSTDGDIGRLKSQFEHDDRKPLSRWLDSQRKYAKLEAAKLSRVATVAGLADRLRWMIWPAAPAAFVYTLFGKRLILDGWAGWYYVLQRTYAELLLSLELLELRLSSKAPDSDHS